MGLYRAYNGALPATTALSVATSYTTGAKCALQLAAPSGAQCMLTGWGISIDADPTAAAAAKGCQWEIVANATATTGLTTHTTTTIKPMDDPLARASSLTMGTAATGYGAVAITTATPTRVLANGYCPMTSGLDIILPSDMLMYFGQSGAAEYLQFRVSTTVTADVGCYFTWREL